VTGPVPGPPRPGMFPRPVLPGGHPAPRPGQAPGQVPGAVPGPVYRPAGDAPDRGAAGPDAAGRDRPGHDAARHEAADGTGHPAVDAALQALANAARLDPVQQVAAYDEAHRTLQETLASIDRT
jgi:hypothetical protein